MKRLLPLLIVLALAACQTVTAVDPGTPQTIDNRWVFATQRAWTRIGLVEGGTIFTLDGVELNAMRFFSGIEDGKSLVKVPEDIDIGVWHADMTASEIVELFRRTYEAGGITGFQTKSIAPAEVSGRKGVRFAFSFDDSNGLLVDGLALAVTEGKRLDLVVFTAPREHYYAVTAGEIETIFANMKLVGGAS